MNPVIASTLHEGFRTSPTIRALVDELDRSDLIVYVTGFSADEYRRLRGTMRFVAVAGGRRFLRITVNERLLGDEQASALGHELQHAVEVAREPWVIDQASFEDLYRHIGQPSAVESRTPCYETEAARRAGERVLTEIRTARHTLAAVRRLAKAVGRMTR